MTTFVVFDLDGTLADTLVDICNAANDALGAFRSELVPFSPAETREMIGDGAKALLQKMLLARGVVENVERSVMECHDLFIKFYGQRLLEHTTAYPGVEHGLRELQLLEREGKVVMCICTNKPHELAMRLVASMPELAQFFSPPQRFVTGAKPLVQKKPDLAHLLHAMKQASEKGEMGDRVIMIGDGRNDILVGQDYRPETAFISIAVTYGFGQENELVQLKPNHVAHSFAQVVRIVQSIVAEKEK